VVLPKGFVAIGGKPCSVPGVPRELIEHSLNVNPKATPKREHLRHFTDDIRDAIKKELAKLPAAGFIREVFHPEWLANPVLVRKNSNEWRMCIDYTDLNKHCPKDPFGLPRIDQVIDSTTGCDLLCFLDYYSGYHQIAIKEEDQEKTAFITPFGAYCYTTMSFGLKNADATYQQAIQVLTVYFGTPSMFITLWFGFDYGTNPPLGTLII
jgi:hypothetical protein